ncbi:MAG: transcriptional regulator [Myxococcaceae bacterium]|nr:transcriptional regulator [Myxococcaceae bacterium]
MLHTFLDFELDEELSELRSQGQVIAAQSRVFDMIVYLLRARDRVVRRDELMDALWQGNVVSDAAISQVIMLARKAVRDEGESQRVIKTLRGRGIRFVADVQSRSREAEPRLSMRPAPELVEPSAPDPLLGRAAELSMLSGRLARAELGRGGLVLIEGDPGMGKTSLAEALAATAQRRGFEVVWGRAWEDGGAPPFWPWIQVLRAIGQREGPEQVRKWLGTSAAELMPLLPELGSSAGSRSEALELDGARARFRQFDVLSRLLRHLCGRDESSPRRPWLIILDDLHAADDASVQLVRFLMPELGELGLLVVATYRGLERKGALATLAESCGDHTLQLRGLGSAEVHALLERKLGRPASGRVASTLHELSAGNPLLLGELCRRADDLEGEPLLDLGQLADFALPERIAGAVRRHLSELPDATREALSAASALGRELSQPLLAELLDCAEPELLARLSPAMQRGVLRPARARGHLLFSHALVCNAIYSEISPARRLALHREIGELLERDARARQPPLHELAHHFFLAAADGCRGKALRYAVLAAEQANQVMGHEVSAALYDRAVSLAELEHVEAAQLHDLLCRAGAAWSDSGDSERGVTRFDRAAALARAAHDPVRYAEATLMSCSALRAVVQHDAGRQAQLREALSELPEGDSLVRARLLAISDLGLRATDSLRRRQASTRAGVEMARRLGDPEVLLWTLNATHLVLWGAAPPEEMIIVAREMIALAQRAGYREVLLDALLWLGCDYAELGDLVNMRRVREDFAAAAEGHNSPLHRYMLICTELLEAVSYGDVARARELSGRARTLGIRLQDPLAETFHALQVLFLDYQEGKRFPPASSPFQHVETPACVTPHYRAFWALTWADAGYREVARNLLVQTLAQQDSLLDPLRRPVLAVLAQACVLLDERAAAEQIYRALQPEAGRHLILQACIYLGSVDHYLGILAGFLGHAAAASEHFEHALSGAMTPPSMVQTQLEYGCMLASTGGLESRQRARQLLAPVEQNGRTLGMLRAAERARATLEGMP